MVEEIREALGLGLADTEHAYRAVLGGWGDPMSEDTWATLVLELIPLAKEYGEDLAELVTRAS